MIDLHCHSLFSDGQYSTEILLEKALAAGVKILALTDHDTIAGLAPLRQAADNKKIHIIKGIELSARWKLHDIHIIGLQINPDEADLLLHLEKQNNSRNLRAHKIAECLKTHLGLEDAYAKASAISGHGRIARPHFAQVLVNEGFVANIPTAFERYLKRGRCAYVATEWLDIAMAVATIRQANGVAVIAHPLKYKLTATKLQELIREFKLSGGTGLEVVSGFNSTKEKETLAGLCVRYDLLASSGSDFHNDASNVGLGCQGRLPLNCTPIWHGWPFEE